MNKLMMIGAVISTGVATTGGAISGYKFLMEPTYAEVINSVEVTQEIKTPREECKDVTVTKQRPVKDQNRIAGKAIGALVGGVLGNQVGGGNGKKAATVLGAVAGGFAGDRVQNNLQKSNTYTTVEQQCNTVYDTRTEVIGYDITYRLKDQQQVVRMSFDPGTQIPLKDGQLDLTPPIPAQASTN